MRRLKEDNPPNTLATWMGIKPIPKALQPGPDH
jgi:hypothetical protein